MRRIFSCGGLILLMLFISGCGKGKIPSDDHDFILRDIAYGGEYDTPYKIGIEENGEIVPYLVLTDDYNGNCLLLREHLLDEPMRYNPNEDVSGHCPAYYETSEISGYLNGDFYDALSDDVKDKIVESEIVITAEESLGVYKKETKTIRRKIFLLSYAELGGEESATNLAEGEALAFFKDNESRIATDSSGEAGSWWLRTPNTWDQNVVCAVSVDGVVVIGGVGGPVEGYLSGVRPAFCLPGDTAVYEDEIEGETMFLIGD